MKRTCLLTSRSLLLQRCRWITFTSGPDGSNDRGASQTGDANGVRAILQRTIGEHLIFVLPFVFQEDNDVGRSVIGSNSLTADSFVLDPFVLFQTPFKITELPLMFFVSSGYRVVVVNNGDIQPIAPDVNGWNGTFGALARLDYGLNKNVSLSGSATWSHLTNFYLSKVAQRPDDNTFALGTSATFIRDYYSHSFTAVGSYSLY